MKDAFNWSFDLGLDHLGLSSKGDQRTDLEQLITFNRSVLANSSYWNPKGLPKIHSLLNNELIFDCPIDGERIRGCYQPAKKWRKGKKGIVIVPALGTTADRYSSLMKLFSYIGIECILIDLPGHGVRETKEAFGAQALLSANLGRTIQQFRKAIASTCAAMKILVNEGLEEISVLGISVGSCISSLASLYGPDELKQACYTFATSDVAKVVWTGSATIGLREELNNDISLEELEKAWLALSPIAHLEKLDYTPIKTLIVSADADTVIETNLTESLVKNLRNATIPVEWYRLKRCDHYSIGTVPYSLIWGQKVLRFFA